MAASRTSKDTPTAQTVETTAMPFIRGLLQGRGLSENASSIIQQSWRPGTTKQYKSYLLRWENYCREKKINSLAGTVIDGINFLSELYQEGLSYSSINTARSALSAVISISGNMNFGNNAMVTRFMRGVFCSRPSLPRYSEIWDVSLVLNYIKKWQPLADIDLKTLTLKTVTLMALTSGQRCQTLHALDIDHMIVVPSYCNFEITQLLKTSKPNNHFGQLKFIAYTPDENLCVVTCLKEYLKRTEPLRLDCKSLLISYVKPHYKVSTNTISRWLKEVLKLSGIDTSIFTAHSFRSAASSAAKSLNVPIDKIMATAGWKSSQTFQKFYDKPILSDNFGFADDIF